MTDSTEYVTDAMVDAFRHTYVGLFDSEKDDDEGIPLREKWRLAIYAAMQAAWRPIDELKSGAKAALVTNSLCTAVSQRSVRYDIEEHGEFSNWSKHIKQPPTHYQPLPPPPKENV